MWADGNTMLLGLKQIILCPKKLARDRERERLLTFDSFNPNTASDPKVLYFHLVENNIDATKSRHLWKSPQPFWVIIIKERTVNCLTRPPLVTVRCIWITESAWLNKHTPHTHTYHTPKSKDSKTSTNHPIPHPLFIISSNLSQMHLEVNGCHLNTFTPANAESFHWMTFQSIQSMTPSHTGQRPNNTEIMSQQSPATNTASYPESFPLSFNQGGVGRQIFLQTCRNDTHITLRALFNEVNSHLHQHRLFIQLPCLRKSWQSVSLSVPLGKGGVCTTTNYGHLVCLPGKVSLNNGVCVQCAFLCLGPFLQCLTKCIYNSATCLHWVPSNT